MSRAAVLGEECGLWAQAVFDARGVESVCSIMETFLLQDLEYRHPINPGRSHQYALNPVFCRPVSQAVQIADKGGILVNIEQLSP